MPSSPSPWPFWGAQAQTVPFTVTGDGYVGFVPAAEGQSAAHWAVGTATGLGQYYGEGTVRLDRFTGPTTAESSSAAPFVFGSTDPVACT